MHRTVKSKINHGGRILFNCDFVDEEKKNLPNMEKFFRRIENYPADERCDKNGLNYKEVFLAYFAKEEMGNVFLRDDVDINIELINELAIKKRWKELYDEIMNDFNKLVAYYQECQKPKKPEKINFLK